MTPDIRENWHLPHFSETLCGTMSDRERLGMPERFVEWLLQEAVALATSSLRQANRSHLAALVTDIDATLAQRIAAGTLLAIAGDPRIDAQAPRMIEIQGGTVHVGLAEDALDATMAMLTGLGLDRSWIEKECPRHRQELAPFRMARYPVTNLEYRTFLLDTGHADIPSSWSFRRFPEERANHPVYSVTPQSADAYARWLSVRTGRAFRLPSETEWEYAAAGPAGLEFPWGASYEPGLANTAETGLMMTTPVGVFIGGQSPFGIFDMAGNVEEYVSNDYAPYPGGAQIDDHLVQLHGHYRVARGGCFSRFRDLARTRRRHGHNPHSQVYAMGFRLAETIAGGTDS